MVGQPPAYVSKHFVFVEKVPNNSNRSLYKCKHCEEVLQHRDNKLLNHLKDPKQCPEASKEDRNEALKALMLKGGLAPETATPGAILEAGGSKKRKGGTLDGYVDHPMSEAQKNDADVKLLR